jgi:AP-4 complex subunit beta-1
MESFIDNFTKYNCLVKLEILSGSMKLFFKRPKEMQLMLGRLFKVSIKDVTNADVHDRALYYYRLLENDIDEAKKIICVKKTLIENFTEEDSNEYKDKLFTEFNTLSIPYGKPSETFIMLDEKVDEEVEEKKKYKEEEKSESESDNESTQKMEKMNIESEINIPQLITPKKLSKNDFQTGWKNFNKMYFKY